MSVPARTLSNRDVAALFEEASAIYDRQSNPYTTARRAEALACQAQGLTLEVGGGTGAVTARLGDRCRAIHSDIAPGMCRIAARKLGCSSVCFDAEALPLGDGQVDTVLSAEMIYYLARPQRFLREAYRALRPGGRLVLSSTNPTMSFLDRGRAMLRKLGFRRMFFEDGAPTFPSRAQIERELLEAGFVVERISYAVVLPFAFCDALNRLLERTPLRRLGLFVIVTARKPAAR